MTSTIAFLSDLGIRDEVVGVCHAVISRIAPDVRVLDLSHGIAPLDIQGGALALFQALPYVEPDAIVLAVVDPGSGTDRHALAVGTRAGRVMVGPDNGLLSLAWAADGGLEWAVAITSPEIILQPHAPVLDARDVFAPAAAHLAVGAVPSTLGSAVDVASLVAIDLGEPDIAPRRIGAEVIDIDRFGNVRLNVRPAHLDAAGFRSDEVLELATTTSGARARRIRTYGEAGREPCGALEDAWGWISIIRFGASAADLLGVHVGDLVWMLPAD